MEIDWSKASNAIVVANAVADPKYAPYCMRCPGFHRMSVVEPLYWRHSCGAEHDERNCISPSEDSTR